MAQLNAVADEHNLRIHLLCQPGTFATPARPLWPLRGKPRRRFVRRSWRPWPSVWCLKR
ncbi:hypothetical protein [Xanthomonas arboricola]|uniref:hypothetical protein n=1 Tax=Xanthomonas arboricola TaxID=56448 RepID=UPI003CCE87BA